MSKAVLVTDKQLKSIIDVARVASPEHALRNIALIYTLFGTGLTPKEIAQLQVADYCKRNGSVIQDGKVRAEAASNGVARPLMWVAPKLVDAIDAYLEHRVSLGLGVAMRVGDGAGYRGLQPKSALFRKSVV